MKRNFLHKLDERYLRMAFYVTLLFLFAQVYHVFFSIYRLQSPIILQSPIVKQITVSPIAEPTSRDVVATPEAEIVPTVSPSPTPKQKAVRLESAVSEAYSYKNVTHLMDDAQKLIMKRVEERLGEAGAQLVYKESGFHNMSVNSSSGACGLFQAYPCEKMGCELDDVDCQLSWGMKYIENRYGSPQEAWAFHVANGWY